MAKLHVVAIVNAAAINGFISEHDIDVSLVISDKV
jgi:hypothetical protein